MYLYDIVCTCVPDHYYTGLERGGIAPIVPRVGAGWDHVRQKTRWGVQVDETLPPSASSTPASSPYRGGGILLAPSGVGPGASSQMEEKIVAMMSAMEARLLAVMKAEVAKLEQPPQARLRPVLPAARRL